MSPVAGDFGGRRIGGALPRVQAAPETNLIQNPAVTRAVQLFAGLRQAHVTPALTEGLSPVLVTGDIRSDPRARLPLNYAGHAQVNGDFVNPFYRRFINPPDHTRIVVLRRFHAFAMETCPPVLTYLYYNHPADNIIPSVATVPGLLTWFGYGDAAQLFPPTQDYPRLQETTTRAGWETITRNGNNGGYFWRAPFLGTTAPTYSDILEEFNGVQGPRIILWPGSHITFGISSGDAQAYFNMWWDEYPLS
jgi:hypothetical protein